MKILTEETVVRYHVEYDEEETILLKGIGMRPPQATRWARLWLTAVEIAKFDEMLDKALTGRKTP